MRVTLLDEPQHLTYKTAHCAFTDIARWHGRFYCAYREAASHGIAPPGEIIVRSALYHPYWHDSTTLTYPEGDLRDPKFVITDEYLHLFCGAYVPSPHLQHVRGLSSHSGDNQIWSLVTYTRDGVTWAPLRPFLRPNYWAWSACLIHDNSWRVASYHTGVTEASNLITLWGGSPLSGWRNLGVMYDGGCLEREADVFRYAAVMPSEPVLFRPNNDTLGCFLRTESTMLLGAWQMNKAWRWHDTELLLHPSACVETPHGWLLASRELTPVYRKDRWEAETTQIDHCESSVVLYSVEGNRLAKRLTLQDKAGDAGYCGMCRGEQDGEWLVSYYASHEAPSPCADVYIAKIEVKD